MKITATDKIFWNRVFPIIILILVFASRIPLITSDGFKADGDESIVGLMAKAIVDHADFKVYFWGQQYGFVTFETSIAALAFKVFGMNVYSLKLSMLFLWATGCIFLYKAVNNTFGFRIAVLFTILLIACPAWGLWSMKARGGYITAFLFSGLVGWIITTINSKRDKKLLGLWIVMGLSISIIYFAQKLWLLSLLPFILTLFIRKQNIRGLVIMMCAIAGTALTIHYFSIREMSNYWKYDFAPAFYFPRDISTAFNWLHVHFNGAYFLSFVLHGGTINEISGWVWVVTFALLLVIQIIRLVTRNFNPLSHLLFLSACLSTIALFNSHSDYFEYRYLLPMDVPLILCFVIECAGIASLIKWDKVYALLLFSCFNFMGLYQLRNITTEYSGEAPEQSFSVAMKEMTSYLESKDVHYTFSQSAALLWQISFYSNGQVLSRYHDAIDRNASYTSQVTNAFKAGKPAAIIDYYNSETLNPNAPAIGIGPSKILAFGKQFSVYLYPDKKTLEGLHFDLK